MNKNIDLVEILKDCPRGTKLYSTIYGEVKFEEIINDKNYPIVFKYSDIACEYYIGSVTKDGRHKIKNCGECTLFPDKDQRDWSKFNIEPKLVDELVDGEIYYAKTKYAEWIYIYRKNYTYETNHYAAVLNYYLFEFNNICTTHNEEIKILRKATEEEKRMLFKIIEENGRKWDADKKELVRIEKKFDISTLQHFDKVLTRDWNDSIWRCNIYEYFKEGQCYPFITMNGVCNQCVPYNSETKHLVGTSKMPPEKYITWEG